MRGKARKELGKYELALKDLAASQSIDFDESVVEDLKFVTDKHVEHEKAAAEKRREEEERLRKRAEDIKKAQEEAKREAEEEEAKSRGASSGGMPGGMGGMPGGMPGMPGGMGGMPGMVGMGGGMPGMPDMTELMSDPEIMAGFQNPKIMKVFQEMMSAPGGPAAMMNNPAKLQSLMGDPEIGPFLQKVLGKLGGGAMGGGGFPGAGFPGAGGREDDEDMPDMPDISEVD
jgi:suppressor of tumorigenicity protein 13